MIPQLNKHTIVGYWNGQNMPGYYRTIVQRGNRATKLAL